MKKFLSLASAFMLLWYAAPGAYGDYDSLSYLYAGDTAIYLNNVGRTKDSLTGVCPDYFEVDAAGGLKLTRPVDPLFIDAMHARGIAVTPFVSNHWNRDNGRAALRNREALSDALAARVREDRLDG
ncbi:MAG: glycoside hydrolase, partial [Oscillospiraceae bacterium]|nr:glycoside hydrolase [Oscillospiraceae bacterium]